MIIRIVLTIALMIITMNITHLFMTHYANEQKKLSKEKQCINKNMVKQK
jgi:hypothetical protein